jgi:flagellar hook-associated protein 1 FlgK
MSLSGALATASRSLELFSLGIQVAGHNISNASTPGYVRDQLVLEANAPYRTGGVLIGTGALATGVQQQLDSFLESRIYNANTDFSAANIRNESYLQLQTALQELGEEDLSTSLNDFVSALQAAVNQPDDPSLRAVVVQQGNRLATDVQSLRQRVDALRETQSDRLRSLVDEANGLIQKVAELNPQISQLEANGLDRNDAGGLRIQRLNALQRLSEILPIRVQEQPSGAVDVFTDSDYILLSGHYQQLETTVAPLDDGVAQLTVQLSRTNRVLGDSGGELGGLVESRDQILGGFVNQLDRLIGGVIYEFNKLHSAGEGLIGYSTVTGTYAVDDTTAALNAAGLDFTPQHGSFQLKVRNVGSDGETVSNVAVDLDGLGTDTSLEDLRAALDALDHVTATITATGELRLSAESGYELRFGNDTSGALAALGINTFFSGHDSQDISVQAHILQDARYLATGQGGGPADNRNAHALATFLDNAVDNLGGLTLEDFHTQLIGTLAQSAAAEEALAGGFEGFRDSLQTQREQRSGVSLDEEAILVMQLQRNYQAAARIVSTIDQLLNTLLNI